MTNAMQRATEIAAKASAEYQWLQAVCFDAQRALPWVCVDCRNGTIHTFKNVDDARYYAETNRIAFYL